MKYAAVTIDSRTDDIGFCVKPSTFHESVAHPADGLDIFSQRTQLFSKAHDLDIHAAVGDRVVVTAHRIHDLRAGKDPARATGEKIEHLEFRIGQIPATGHWRSRGGDRYG